MPPKDDDKRRPDEAERALRADEQETTPNAGLDYLRGRPACC